MVFRALTEDTPRLLEEYTRSLVIDEALADLSIERVWGQSWSGFDRHGGTQAGEAPDTQYGDDLGPGRLAERGEDHQ